ncbi:hypothetical protein B0H67DRAFT_334309 [Lasiosphaeris hirsuta]|uniref:Uncharacterized protein n=1 Tax=Lasiosphaeris hirsuta TaxID=260670 RepID=A0AA40A2T6_9PEZI|nr:hypothetical protein B0H67DRAFT_334309 [Lasiosphaeris hirsuta]
MRRIDPSDQGVHEPANETASHKFAATNDYSPRRYSLSEMRLNREIESCPLASRRSRIIPSCSLVHLAHPFLPLGAHTILPSWCSGEEGQQGMEGTYLVTNGHSEFPNWVCAAGNFWVSPISCLRRFHVDSSHRLAKTKQ